MVRKRKVNGEWVDIGSEVLKTDVNVEITPAVIPDVISAGDRPFLISDKKVYICPQNTNYNATGITIIIPKDGTYNFQCGGGMEADNGSNYRLRLCKNGEQIGQDASIGGNGGSTTLSVNDIECLSGDIVEVYLRGSRYSSSYDVYGYAGMLIAYINW